MDWKELALLATAIGTGINSVILALSRAMGDRSKSQREDLATHAKLRREDQDAVDRRYNKLLDLFQAENDNCQKALKATRERMDFLENMVMRVAEEAHQVHAQVLATADGRITMVNASAGLLFGYARATDLIGQSIEVLIPPELLDAHRKSFAVAVKGGFPPSYERTLDTFCLCKNGSKRPVTIHLKVQKEMGETLLLATVRQRDES